MSRLLERLYAFKTRPAHRLTRQSNARFFDWILDKITSCLTAYGDVFFVFRKR